MKVEEESWKGLMASYRRHRGLMLMILPCLAFFILFNYIPMIGIIVAFKDYVISDGIIGSRWVGWENFDRLFGSKDFPLALRNTVIISLLRLAFGFFAPIILALLMNEIRVSWYKRSIQTLTYLPYFLSWVILGGIFLMMFSLNGPVNQMVLMLYKPVGWVISLGHAFMQPGKLALGSLAMGDLRPLEFLSNDTWFITVLIATGIWQGAGYGAVIYLAALAGINPNLYEAAVVDGAGRWQQTMHITLPCLVPTIITLFILSMGGILNAGFDQIYNMYNPMVYDSADIIDTYVLRRLRDMDFSLATAAGLFKSAVGLTLVVLSNTIAKRMSGGEQGIW